MDRESVDHREFVLGKGSGFKCVERVFKLGDTGGTDERTRHLGPAQDPTDRKLSERLAALDSDCVQRLRSLEVAVDTLLASNQRPSAARESDGTPDKCRFVSSS